MLKENTLGTCRIRKPKTLWERGNIFSKPYASATTPWRLRGKVDKTKSRLRKLNLDWFKSLTDHYLYNKLPIIPTRHRTQSSSPCRQNSYFCQFRKLQLSEISYFDFTTQSDTTQLTQSHHNCIDTWACRTASATSPYIDSQRTGLTLRISQSV